MSELVERALRALERPAAVAWKDLLVFGKQATGWKGAVGALILLLPLVAAAALVAESAGPWRHLGHAIALGVAALFSTLSFAVTVPAATSVALERDRDTLPALVVSPTHAGRAGPGQAPRRRRQLARDQGRPLPGARDRLRDRRDRGRVHPRGSSSSCCAADISFASFALCARPRPLRPPRMGSPGFKLGVSQAQLALQRSVGFSVLGSLLPIYASVFGIPLVLQQGLSLAHWLETGGALGALHPLFALIAWGPVRLYGRTVPVWTLAVGFHLLLALPLLASAAEAQRAAGTLRGRLARFGFAVWFVYVVAVAAGALREGPGESGALVVAALGGALLAGAALGAGLSAPRRTPFGLREVLLSFIDPRRAALSAPETAPGGAFLLALALTPFVVASAGSVAEALRASAGLGLAAVGIAALGARIAARAQARDAAAFGRALAKRASTRDAAGTPNDADPARATEGDEERLEEPPTGASTVFALGLLFLVLGPAVAALGIALAHGALPQLVPLEPAFRGLAIGSLAANPFSALLPLVDPSTVVAQRLIQALGVEPGTLATLGAALWATAIVLSLGTLRRAPEVRIATAGT